MAEGDEATLDPSIDIEEDLFQLRLRKYSSICYLTYTGFSS
jgi:hypothetical protein